MLNLIVNCDGGSRGNPGPAAVGVVIKKGVSEGKCQMSNVKSDHKDIEIAKYIGEKTNNQAEYQAVIEALKWIWENSINKSNDDIDAEFLLDSELVVKQLNGEYKMKNEGLKPLFREINDLISKIGGNVTFRHVRREENVEADILVNMALDKQSKGK